MTTTERRDMWLSDLLPLFMDRYGDELACCGGVWLACEETDAEILGQSPRPVLDRWSAMLDELHAVCSVDERIILRHLRESLAINVRMADYYYGNDDERSVEFSFDPVNPSVWATPCPVCAPVLRDSLHACTRQGNSNTVHPEREVLGQRLRSAGFSYASDGTLIVPGYIVKIRPSATTFDVRIPVCPWCAKEHRLNHLEREREQRTIRAQIRPCYRYPLAAAEVELLITGEHLDG